MLTEMAVFPERNTRPTKEIIIDKTKGVERCSLLTKDEPTETMAGYE